MAEGHTLAKPVYLGGELIPAGTELTEEQAGKITNPKAFQADPTLADKVQAAQQAYEKALREAEAAAGPAPDTAAVSDDRAENGAALARAAKAAGAKPGTK